jgi:hypothetical protein
MVMCVSARSASEPVSRSTSTNGAGVAASIRDLHPGQHHGGSAETFDLARAAFEEAWQKLLPKIPEGAFEEYHRDRAGRAQIASARERGEKLPSELPSSFMRCVCGAKFDSNRPDESLPHRRHIYAANGIPR